MANISIEAHRVVAVTATYERGSQVAWVDVKIITSSHREHGKPETLDATLFCQDAAYAERLADAINSAHPATVPAESES